MTYANLRAIRRPHLMQLVWLDQLTSECATDARWGYQHKCRRFVTPTEDRIARDRYKKLLRVRYSIAFAPVSSAADFTS